MQISIHRGNAAKEETSRTCAELAEVLSAARRLAVEERHHYTADRHALHTGQQERIALILARASSWECGLRSISKECAVLI